MGNLRVLWFDPDTKTKLLIKYNQLKVKYRSNVKTDGYCCFLKGFYKTTVTFCYLKKLLAILFFLCQKATIDARVLIKHNLFFFIINVSQLGA